MTRTTSIPSALLFLLCMFAFHAPVSAQNGTGETADTTAADTTVNGTTRAGTSFLSLNKTPFARATDDITNSVRQAEVEQHVYFLASDELKGRVTGSPELAIAARYIAEWLRANGVSPVPGHDYFQEVPLIQQITPEAGELVVNDSTFRYMRDFVVINNQKAKITAPVTVLRYGEADEISQSDVSGKIVVVRAGYPEQNSPQQWYVTTENKIEHLQQAGALAVIELFDNKNFAWQVVQETFDGNLMDINPGTGADPIPYLWFNSIESNMHRYFSELEAESIQLTITGKPNREISARNVVGYIEGTDPELKKEHLLLGAHYDHIGVASIPQEQRPVEAGSTETATAEVDSIYNGARDNAIGTSAIMHAARFLAKNPPRRSIIISAWTAEEEGLLGSYWFSENPMVPLDQIVFNLNIDSAGYNDTTKVMVIGLERTGAEKELTRAAEAFNLEVISDPVPEQDLFNRSDNVNFAIHGIPAPTYSVGLTAFDEEINHYYHTVEDNPETVNYSYITCYIRSFVMAARLLANQDEAPFWQEGDFYEAAGINLYGQ